MRLIDFLFNRKNDRLYNDMEAVNNYADAQKAEALTANQKPALTPLQMTNAGGLDADGVRKVKDFINSPEARTQLLDERLQKAQAVKPTFAQRLLGRDISADVQFVDPETNAVTMETKSLHQPGYFEQAGAGLKRGLNDLLGGYNENRTQNFSVDNWNNNYLDNGNKKGLAYRLGEGLGSFAKLAESPIGRSLLVGGIVGATGGDGLQALTYGAQTGMMNQQNRAKDQMYRKALAERGIDTSGIRGYVGDSMFKSILEDAQLRDNAEYRNAMLQTQVNNQREMMEYRKQEAERQARQDRIDTDIAYKKLGLQEKALEQKGQESKGKVGNMANLTAVSNQLKRFEDSFATMPNKLESNTLGRLRNATGFQTKEEANFDSQRTLLFNKIARDLGGEKGVLSDQDIKRVEKSLPSYTDSIAQKRAKMAAIYDLLNDRLTVEGGNVAEVTDADPLGIL
jgi:hypothetical protein